MIFLTMRKRNWLCIADICFYSGWIILKNFFGAPALKVCKCFACMEICKCSFEILCQGLYTLLITFYVLNLLFRIQISKHLLMSRE